MSWSTGLEKMPCCNGAVVAIPVRRGGSSRFMVYGVQSGMRGGHRGFEALDWQGDLPDNLARA